MQPTPPLSDDALVRGEAAIGDIQITICTDGTCLFDGGAMFGVVPKTLWSRKVDADDQNRVTLGLNCVVVKTADKTILIETGFGNKLSPKLREICATQQRLPDSLAAAGIMPESVDIVINTHLHWDHCSWNTVLDPGGNPRPFFPRAQYIAHRGEVEHGHRQYERDRISYVSANYDPLIATGQMVLVEDGDFTGSPIRRCSVAEGITLELVPGHTAHLMAVHLESRGQHACFCSDLIPTSAHLELSWAMAFDLDPHRTIEERKRFYARAIPENWLVLFPHDHRIPMAYLQLDEKQRVHLAR